MKITTFCLSLDTRTVTVNRVRGLELHWDAARKQRSTSTAREVLGSRLCRGTARVLLQALSVVIRRIGGDLLRPA